MKKSLRFLFALCFCIVLLAACASNEVNAASTTSQASTSEAASTITQSPAAPAGMHLVYQQTGSYTAQMSETFQLNGKSVIAFACKNGGDFGVLAYDAIQRKVQVSSVMTSQCNPQDSNQEAFTFNGPAYVSITADSYNTQIAWAVVVFTQN